MMVHRLIIIRDQQQQQITAKSRSQLEGSHASFDHECVTGTPLEGPPPPGVERPAVLVIMCLLGFIR